MPKGIKNLAVVTPAFVSDCLESEEIVWKPITKFKEHGGEEFRAIPCLNDDDDWCQTVETDHQWLCTTATVKNNDKWLFPEELGTQDIKSCLIKQAVLPLILFLVCQF
jgi:hypothetical protein